jgi:hypothetical protein
VLDDPAVSDLPDTVRRVREDLLPLIGTLRGGADALDRFPAARSLLGSFRPPRPAAEQPANGLVVEPVRTPPADRAAAEQPTNGLVVEPVRTPPADGAIELG